jgi:hypothetical protein
VSPAWCNRSEGIDFATRRRESLPSVIRNALTERAITVTYRNGKPIRGLLEEGRNARLSITKTHSVERLMTMLSLSLTASFPGVWELPASLYRTVTTVAPADPYGNPTGDSTSETIADLETMSLDIGGSVQYSTMQQILLTDLWFDGTAMSNAAGLVTVVNYQDIDGLDPAPVTSQSITADGAWNQIKDASVTHVTTDALTVTNFVDTDVDTGDTAAHSIDIEDAKRGNIVALGQTNLTIHYLSNEYTWSNEFDVNLGDANNIVFVAPATLPEAASVVTLQPMTFNSAPQDTLINLSVGNGNNEIITQEASANIHLGSGNDTVSVTDGNHNIWLGDGSTTVTVESNPQIPSITPLATAVGSDAIYLGSGGAAIFLSDDNLATMPQTTVVVPEIPGSSSALPVVMIQYGHLSYPDDQLIGGDWSHVSIDFTGFAPGSTLNLFNESGSQALVATDPVDHAARVITLEGGMPTLAQLHIRFD